jgi:hypothetical protein
VPGVRWVPTRLRWGQHRGWSATLTPTAAGHLGAVARYLPGQLVPAPSSVARFVRALLRDPDTIWAAATFRAPPPIDRRWLILQLSRFAVPEPW